MAIADGLNLSLPAAVGAECAAFTTLRQVSFAPTIRPSPARLRGGFRAHRAARIQAQAQGKNLQQRHHAQAEMVIATKTSSRVNPRLV